MNNWIQKAKALLFDCLSCVDSPGLVKEIEQLLEDGGGYDYRIESSETPIRSETESLREEVELLREKLEITEEGLERMESLANELEESLERLRSDEMRLALEFYADEANWEMEKDYDENSEGERYYWETCRVLEDKGQRARGALAKLGTEALQSRGDKISGKE